MKAICWDLRNVLIRVDHGERRDQLKKIVRGQKGREQAVDELYARGFNGYSLDDALDLGLVHGEFIHCRLCDMAGLRINYDDFRSIYLSFRSLFVPVVNLAKQLQQHGCITVTVSDCPSLEAGYVLDLLSLYGLKFDHEFISYRERMKKPHLIQYTAEKLAEAGVAAHEAIVYVDDNRRHTETAWMAGMIPIHFDAVKQSAEWLAGELWLLQPVQ